MKKILLSLICLFLFVSPSVAQSTLDNLFTDVIREGTVLTRNVDITNTTCKDALIQAFESMGWSHEIWLASQLSYEEPVIFLVDGLNIKPPQSILNDVNEPLTKDKLEDLLEWVGCASQLIEWRFERVSTNETLVLYKTGVKKADKMFEVLVASGDISMCREKLKEISGDIPTAIRISNDCCELIVGPFDDARTAQSYNAYVNGIVRQSISQQLPDPIFVAAVISPIQPTLTFAYEQKKGKLPLSKMVQISDLFAINGGYFYMNVPVGTMVWETTPIHMPFKNRSGVGFDNSNVYFGNVKYDAVLECSGLNIPIARINDLPQSKYENVLFLNTENSFLKPNPNTSMSWQTQEIEVKHQNKILRGVLWSQDKSILSWLKTRPHTELKTRWLNPQFKTCQTVIQAGPMIVLDEKIWTETEDLDVFIRLHKQPRTLVGTDKANRTWWIVVDGRNRNHSVGVSLSECVSLIEKFGLTNVLNLDGGGSTELIWHNKIINVVSENGVERPLPYCFTFK